MTIRRLPDKIPPPPPSVHPVSPVSGNESSRGGIHASPAMALPPPLPPAGVEGGMSSMSFSLPSPVTSVNNNSNSSGRVIHNGPIPLGTYSVTYLPEQQQQQNVNENNNNNSSSSSSHSDLNQASEKYANGTKPDDEAVQVIVPVAKTGAPQKDSVMIHKARAVSIICFFLGIFLFLIGIGIASKLALIGVICVGVAILLEFVPAGVFCSMIAGRDRTIRVFGIIAFITIIIGFATLAPMLGYLIYDLSKDRDQKPTQRERDD